MNPTIAPQFRALAETVRRLVDRDKPGSAVHLVARTLSEAGLAARTGGAPAGPFEQACLLNLRGVAHAAQGNDTAAAADFVAAADLAPRWVVPLLNLGLHHKAALRWQEAADCLRRAYRLVERPHRNLSDRLLSDKVEANLGTVLTALGKLDEARVAWGLTPQASRTDLGLGQMSLPTQGPYSVERVWIQRIDQARARILSVVRYGGPCQFGDVVLCERPQVSEYCDGLLSQDDEDRGDHFRFLAMSEPGGFALHVVHGSKATPTQAMALTERLREQGLHVEVWSLTMRLPKDKDEAKSVADRVTSGDPDVRPLCAGLVVAQGPENKGETPIAGVSHDPRVTAEKAAAALRAAGTELKLDLYSPTLQGAAGDELGALRHKRAVAKLLGTSAK